MKIIPKFQSGGSYDSFMSIYQPIQTPREQSSGSSPKKETKESKEDSGLLDEKTFFEMLNKIDGLPNEIQYIANKLLYAFQEARDFGGDVNDLAVQYISALSEIKIAKFNKEQFDEAYKRAVEKNNLNDWAITTSGKIVVIDNKTQKMTYLSPSQWSRAKNSNKYSPVTNSNLLWLRYNHPKYIKDNTILQTVENGIGLDQVNKMIKDSFQSMGKVEQSSEMYISKEAVKGHTLLEQALAYGPDGIYKIKHTTSKTEDAQIQATLNYIYTNLPANAKTRLALETKHGSAKEVYEVIQNFIFGTLNYKDEYSYDYEGIDETDKTSGSTDKDNNNKDKINIAEKLIAGLGNNSYININIGTEFGTTVLTNTLPIVGKEDKDLGVMAPVSEMYKSSLSRVLDTANASIAGSIISSSYFNQILLTDNKITTIDYPCYRTQNGNVLPDLRKETSEKKSKADEELKQQGIDPYNKESVKYNYLTINNVYKKHELPEPYTQNGDINFNNYARFAVVQVVADERIAENLNKQLLQKIDGYERDAVVSQIQDSTEQYKDNKSFLGLGGDDIYKGTMWIPVIDSYSMAHGPEQNIVEKAQEYNEYDQAQQNQVTLTRKQI